MIELLLDAIVSLGSNGMQNVLTSVGESAVKKFRESQAWKKLIVGTGEFFIKNEQEENSFFEDLELVLSKENLTQIAKELKSDEGYELKHRLYARPSIHGVNLCIRQQYKSFEIRLHYSVLRSPPIRERSSSDAEFEISRVRLPFRITRSGWKTGAVF